MRTSVKAILVVLSGGLLGFLAVMAVLCVMGHGWIAQIRLDCGDLRYCYLGFSVLASPMPEPARTTLTGIADESLTLRPEYHTCEVFPRRSAVPVDQRCRDAYRRVAAWADADRTIARLALEDLAEYIERTDARAGAPACAVILGADVIDSTIGDVLPDWRTNANVIAYCAAKGYPIPGNGAPASAPAATSPASRPTVPPSP